MRDTIERLHGIPSTKQVLMISGGEVLNPTKRVSSYPSGTDENPIYMFSILFDSSKLMPPWPSESRKCPLPTESHISTLCSINCDALSFHLTRFALRYHFHFLLTTRLLRDLLFIYTLFYYHHICVFFWFNFTTGKCILGVSTHSARTHTLWNQCN